MTAATTYFLCPEIKTIPVKVKYTETYTARSTTESSLIRRGLRGRERGGFPNVEGQYHVRLLRIHRELSAPGKRLQDLVSGKALEVKLFPK